MAAAQQALCVDGCDDGPAVGRRQQCARSSRLLPTGAGLRRATGHTLGTRPTHQAVWTSWRVTRARRSLSGAKRNPFLSDLIKHLPSPALEGLRDHAGDRWLVVD